MSSLPLSITGLGMMTALGQGAEGVCAAIRAGISRPHPMNDFQLWDPEAQDEVPLLGHPVAGITDGFQGLGRWSRLGHLALRDLVRYARLTDWPVTSWMRCGLMLCTPHLSPERFTFGRREVDALAGRLLQATSLPIATDSRLLFMEGESGVWQALKTAEKNITSGRWDRAILLAVDSLLDAGSLRWLATTGRLKGPEQPVGLMPGEAGACVLIEHPRHCQGQPEGTLQGVAVANEPDDQEPHVRRFGRALGRAVEEVLVTSRARLLAGNVVGNLNGEETRAMAWGTTLTQVIRPLGLTYLREKWPAISLGDVGTASVVVSMGYALRAYTRRHAAEGPTLVWGFSERSPQGACLVYPPNP